VLSLYVAEKPTRLGLLRFAFDALRGRLAEQRDFDVLHAPELEIDHPPQAPARGHRRRSQLDGAALALPGETWRTDSDRAGGKNRGTKLTSEKG
jgi:diacylglycerol kinase family enzyme